MRILVDTCVLYPTVMREVVLGCAQAGLFEVRWSARILEEWARAARKIGPEGETLARGEIAGVSARFSNAVVAYPEDKLRQFWLPDKDDIHVLTAAVVGSCDAIMTVNVKDFPKDVLAENDLDRLSPDVYLVEMFHQNPDVVRGVGDAVLGEARRLSGDDWQMRPLMKKARLPRLGKALTA
ncbi:MAG: PIN domain-containing protein [Yoonia sp.]|uniref:RSP_2648 family PIN domain-containing protein n=1 Tax=Yoonia sp. TaxID=2212373 RepID=UPI0032670AB3